MQRGDGLLAARPELQRALPGDERLGLPDVLPAKQKLAVQVGDVDGVQVDHLDVLEPAQHERLEELAPDAAGADHQDFRVLRELRVARRRHHDAE